MPRSGKNKRGRCAVRGDNIFERAAEGGTHSFLFFIYYFLFEKQKPSGLPP